jgi:3-hydroxyisobutyrate dehydrogenase
MSDASARSAAVLGTGIMGAPMARNIAAAGLRTAAWNRHREGAAPLAQDGVEVFEDAADAVRGRDVVITMLPNADVVQAVMSEEVFEVMNEGGHGGAAWIQCSTVGVDGTEVLVALAARNGVRLLDAPVSGTKGPAEAGELVILASGDEAAAQFCAPVFQAIGSKTVWLGEAGNGSRMKLVTNDWVLGVTALMAEALRFCEALGVPPEKLLESIEGAPVGSPYALVKGRLMLASEFEPNFPLEHGAKDTRLIMSAAREAALELPIAAATAAHFAAALDAGAGREDVAAVYVQTGR